MDSQTVFAKLRDALAHLYPTNESARRLADDAGLDARRIRFSAQALENWHAILTEAAQTERLDAMLNIAATEYSSNGDLLAAYGTYCHFVGQGNQIVPLPDIEQRNQGDDRSITAQIGEGAENVNIGQDITQTNIEGNVHTGGGDFTGRDKITHILGDEVHGDKVGGDKLTLGSATDSTIAIGRGSIATSVKNFFFGSSEDTIRVRNRQVMLKLVYDIWVKGVLENSLYNQLLIDLDMEQRPEAVERPWGMVLETPEQASRLLPAGTKMIDVFTELNKSLLILGEPGSGKSTMLLELARDLLAQAEQNPALPIPVLFNLSSWVEKRQPLRQWLADELREKYQIPKTLAKAWVDEDALLLLLDGLDEVKAEYRETCVRAINDFQQSGTTLVPLALCSRTAEYITLTHKLKLNGALVLHPLTSYQINDFLARAGDKLHTVAHLLRHDAEVQTLAQSPLFLNILCLTYQDQAVATLQSAISTMTRLQQLFDAYITQMFQRPGKLIVDHYPRAQTLRWLAWLSAHMVQYAQTEFLIERLQPEWLQSTERKKISVRPIMFLWGPLYGLFFGLVSGLAFGLAFRVPFGLAFGLAFGLRVGLVGGLLFGLLVGLGEWLNGALIRIGSSEQPDILLKKLRSSLYSGLFWTLVFGLVGGLRAGLLVGLIRGSVLGMLGGLVGRFKPIKLVDGVLRPGKQLKRNLLFGLFVGLLVGLLFGLLIGLLEVFILVRGGRLVGESANTIITGLFVCLLSGLLFGLLFEPDTNLDKPYIIITQIPNQGVKRSARFSLLIGPVFGLGAWLAFRLVFGLGAGLAFGLGAGLAFDLVLGQVAGLFVALFIGLVFGLASGGDIFVKHLILRFVLYLRRYAPLNYARFLDYCADRIFLRKVGGGYIFVHRLLMEHFASLTEDDIKRLAG
ncbi:MAG: effector-associated domain EAD1-containing protein [Caldilineaceae bacterium]